MIFWFKIIGKTHVLQNYSSRVLKFRTTYNHPVIKYVN